MRVERAECLCIRAKTGMSQKEFAHALGVSARTIQRAESQGITGFGALVYQAIDTSALQLE